ncbi:hypothetical protein SAMN04487905_103200 [Actinopolyspora xinjiangensis]|uniref:Ig-like domain-containing protein n=1 Tax=Actinopolyspora xinjiangensis TaxID=405564 RepID=A0A1H0RR74_9ACTN|nr:hypothetical protein [Actinopolyspora xinjiangensis]SDP32051.1 hypothetical protein SAMN04487905_103200 [Actinopolyspora xinjiangensis]
MRRCSLFLSVLLALVVTGCSTQSPEGRSPEGEESTAETSTAATTEGTSRNQPMTDAELQSRWWSWARSAPEGQDPVRDATGRFCAVNQPELVWFVAGTYGGTVRRSCRVPADSPLAGPVVNRITDTAAACGDFLAEAEGTASVDGTEITLRRIEPTGITYETRSGTVRGFGCGLWLRVPPLSPGKHTLTLRGSSGEFSTEARYELTVEPTTKG